MKTIQNLLLAVFLLPSFGVMEAGAAPDGGLPALINEKEKGVFYLRVLNKQGQEISSGTGFLVDGKGTLVTALHVILPKRDVVGAVEAMDADGKTCKVEGVTASDSSVDLAVLKLEKVPEGARPLTLAGDVLPVRGAKVLVLGHPRGFQFVATDGIVSATHKTDHLPEPLRQSGFIHAAPDVVWIQTTAAISHGNSGGPLLDESGDVIGIVQWMTGGQGMNFALQVASIRKLLARPAQLQTLESFTEPEADLFILMKDFQMDQMKAQQRDFDPFGFPGDEKKPAAKGNPLLEKYVPALLALATKHRGKDVELQSLMLLMNISSRGDLPPEIAGDVKKAADRLLGNFCDDRRLLSFVRSPFTPTLPEAKDFVISLSKASSEPEIRALAALMSARCVDLNDNGGDSLKTAMEFARAAAQCPPDIKYGPESVAEIAGKLIDMLEHSSAGCAAPELEGIDQDGKPVKLSDLKGRHVVVVFYTAENEFRAGIAGELNDLVKYADGRPLSVIGVLVEFPNRFFTGSGQGEVKKTWSSIKDDADGTLREAWYVTDAPTVFLIDPKSVIRSRYTEPAKPQSGMGFMNMFGGMNRSESDWKKHLNEALKGIPELETEADKAAKLPNRLKASPIDPSLLKGLALRYSFDKKEVGAIQDSSGNSHHAKATGGEWSDDPDAGGCYKLSKPGDKIESLDYKGVSGANPRTAAVWFKNVDTSTRSHVLLLQWGKGTMGENFGLWLDRGAGFLVDACGGQQLSKPAGKELLDGKWHHLAVTLSGGGMLKDIKTYVDGKEVKMSPYTPGGRATGFFRSKPLNTALGTPVTIGSDLVNGFMDEVMIWDRALDGVEIARLYKATGGQKLDPALESAILASNKLPKAVEPPAGKVPAAAGSTPQAGDMKFSDWLKTVSFRSDNGIQLSIEGDRMALTGIKGFPYTIDETSRTVTWENAGKHASITVSPDRKSGVWTMPSGTKHQLAVIQRKPATGEPENPEPALPKDADGWEDQLASLTPAEVEKTGHGWSLKDGEFFGPDKIGQAALPLPGNVAGTSYQVRVKLRQLPATNVFHIILPVADRMCGFYLETRPDGDICTGLGVVNGKAGKEMPGVVKGKRVNDNAPHDLEVTVRLEGANATITTTLDSKPLYEWTGPTAALSQYKPWATTKPGSLALGTYSGGWAVSEVKLKRLEAETPKP